MIVSVQTVLNASVDEVWREVQKSCLLEYVASPLQIFRPLDPPSFPTLWIPGRYRVQLLSFGLIPTGWQDIVISYPEPNDPEERLLRDNGSGAIVKKWDHLMTIRKRTDGKTDYSDRIAIEAGVLTPGVAAFAHIFYRHRQRRWHRLIGNNFNYAQ